MSNFKVRFRDAELTLLYERDHGCRVHSARAEEVQETMKQRERTVLLVTALLMVINTQSFII